MRNARLVGAFVCIVLAGCSGSTPATSLATSGKGAPTPTAVGETASPTPKPAAGSPARATPIARACPDVDEVGFDANQVVPAVANIFGAGHRYAPMPGGGGAGQPPPVWVLPRGSTVVTFACVKGSVNPIRSNPDWNGPQGSRASATRVSSYGGISGIVDEHNAMFVTGVFLTDAEPADPAPERLDFTDAESFHELAPLIGQTFLVGDGVGRRYRVPAGATRLFVGFADAYFFVGEPGWYGNNLGQIEVTVEARPD